MRPLPTARRLLLGLLAIALIGASGAALPASAGAANSPWWKLISNTRPTYLKAGSGTPGVPGEPEIQKISVPLVAELGPFTEQGGFVLLVGSGREERNLGAFSTEPLAAEEGLTPLDVSHLQQALEGPYGAGKVHITESDEAGLLSFTVESEFTKLPISVVEIFSPGPTATIVNQGKPEVPEVADGEVYLTAINVGDADASGATSTIHLEDVLPPGLSAVGVVGTKTHKEGDLQARELIPCELETSERVSCSLKEALVPFDTIEVRIAVNLNSGAHSGELNVATVSGGGASALSISRPITASSDPVPFGISEYEMALEEEGGATPTQAGRHPFQFTTQIAVNQERDINTLIDPTGEFNRPEVAPAGLAKDFHFELPPGLVGNASTLPVCTTSQFFAQVGGEVNKCPADTAVGVAIATVHEPNTVGTSTLTEPIFNLEPNYGEPARFGFYVVIANTPVFIDTSVRSGSDYGITAEANNLTQTGAVLASTATFWGTPGDSHHDQQRGWGCLLDARDANAVGLPCQATEETHPRPFLSMPTQCSSPLRAEGELDQWSFNQGIFEPFSGSFAPSGLLTGCNQVPFGPTVTVEPSEKSAAAATGLTVDLNLKQEGLENQNGLAESDVKKVTVALPNGITTNPSVANGLSACSLAQYNAETLASQSCPESSKVGEVEIESPLVKPVIHGSVYVAKQHDNPANNLLSIYMVAKNPELGILVKSAGAVTPNQQTGQLTTTFDELPQLPFSHFHFAFDRGPRAPLITPGLCGTYTTGADLYPYSNPTVPVHRDASFTVSAGANGGPCATQESQLPNRPTLEAGTTSPIAGAYAPFVFEVNREDGSQVLSTISATLPEGLLGKLAGIPYCSPAGIAQAESRSGEGQGALELASPSCPAASQVGVVNVATGVGSQPYHVAGHAYLAGPYKGAPLSLAIITPAVVGPFDLGTIVVRTALYVNETTAQITAKSDPIPTIVHGLPTVVQSIALNMNRPSFTINPTSCDPKQITGSAVSTLGVAAPLQQRLQVGACGALGFKPSLKLSLKGATKRSGVPALKAVLTYPKGNYANIKSISTVLPKSEFIDNAHIGNTCTRVQFNAGTGDGAQCPKNSILGHAKAYSPLIEKPLEGTVYFRSNGGERELPDLVAALKGQINVTLVGFIDSVKKKGAEVSRVRTRFQNVPDAPVSRFVLQLAGAKKGLLENSANLCKVKNIAQVKATAQNGKTYDTEPAVANDCGKKKHTHK